MPKTLTSNLLNHMCKYANNLLDNKDINLHVDYDGFSALVYENEKTTLYFTFIVDFENRAFIMGTQYFSEWSEILFKEEQNFKSLTIAIAELISIIEVLHNNRESK